MKMLMPPKDQINTEGLIGSVPDTEGFDRFIEALIEAMPIASGIPLKMLKFEYEKQS